MTKLTATDIFPDIQSGAVNSDIPLKDSTQEWLWLAEWDRCRKAVNLQADPDRATGAW